MTRACAMTEWILLWGAAAGLAGALGLPGGEPGTARGTLASVARQGQAAAGISQAELVARRDLWPEKTAMKREVRLSGMAPIAKGTELRVHELTAGFVVLDAGQVLFDLPLADTDVLERARAAMAKMTPEQLALTEASLLARSDLWPLQVALAAELGFTNGVSFEVGREVVLRGVQPDGVWLFDRPTGEAFQVSIQETDLVRRARERLALPAAEREPFFVRALEATIMKGDEIGAPGALGQSDLILVYKGRQGCGRCAAFLPELKSFYAKTKPAHPRFEVVFVSQDATPEQARAYQAEAKVPGLVIAQERNVEAAHLASISGQLLPTVLLFDRAGQLLAQNHPNAGRPSASDLLAEVEKRLQERP